jgi:polysaccharide export outer membrane protein
LPADFRAASDPYTQALQQAMIQQHLAHAQAGTTGYHIGVHDILEINVFGYDKMNRTARVGSNGCINFPPLGEIHAAGLTERQLEAVLQDRLRGKYLQDPHVTVFVKEARAGEVAIVGAVAKPGRYFLLGEKYLVDLLTEAGGMTEKAGNKAYVIRFRNATEANPEKKNPTHDAASTSAANAFPLDTGPVGERIDIDLDGLLLRGEPHWNIALVPGDLVNIPEAGSVHVTGPGIKEPGTYPLTRMTKTLRQVIDEAGGLKFEATGRIAISRRDEQGRKRVIAVAYKDIVRGKREDVVLLAGDVIVLDRSAMKTPIAILGKVIDRVVRVGIGGTFNLAQ